MDWNQWCGPAPMRPFSGKLHPGGWRNFLDYANGTLGDWGVHWLDQVLWWTRRNIPSASSARAAAKLRARRSSTIRSKLPTLRIIRSRRTNSRSSHAFGSTANSAATPRRSTPSALIFYGTNGVLHIGWRDGWTFYPSNNRDAQVHEKSELQEPDGHNLTLLWADFMDAIEQKRPAVARIELAHRSPCCRCWA
jgi:predicted dehydrogenase